MVDIQEVPEDPPKEEAAASSNEKDADGWEKLMGDDLLLKVRRIVDVTTKPTSFFK